MSLFDDLEKPNETKYSIIIDKEISVPIETLDFRYGVIAFRYRVQETGAELEFELLKPYFSKALNSKNISVHIQAEFEDNNLVSQFAESCDIDKINKELIESVRFRFVTKHFFGKSTQTKAGSISEQMQVNHILYASNDELLNDVLKHSKFKHSRHLCYLADRHAAHLLKVRFLLK